MTRPHTARNRHGWLTGHALASGLREQYAHTVGGQDREVQLRCVPKPTRVYLVEYTLDGQLSQSHSFTDLPEARARYVALVHTARRPIKKEEDHA